MTLINILMQINNLWLALSSYTLHITCMSAHPLTSCVASVIYLLRLPSLSVQSQAELSPHHFHALHMHCTLHDCVLLASLWCV